MSIQKSIALRAVVRAALGRRWLGVLLGLASVSAVSLVPVQTAQAAPTQYVLCKAVISNGDTALDSGQFTLSPNVGGSGLATYTATVGEGQKQCDIAKALPANAADITVNELAPPDGWAHAPNYPKWTIAATGLTTVTGSGSTATLSGAAFSGASGTVTITFSNAKARRVTICKEVVDNNTAPAGQGGTFPIRYSSTTIPAFDLPAMTATEGQTVCTDGDLAQGRANPALLGLNDTSFTVTEGVSPGFAQTAGYPRWVVTDANGPVALTDVDGKSVLTLSQTQLSSTSGDLKIVVKNRPDAPRKLWVCQRWEDDGVAPLFNGATPPQTPSTGFNTFVNGDARNSWGGMGIYVAEGRNENCVLIAPPGGESYTTVSNFGMPPEFTAFAAGYPKWEMYNAAGCTPNTNWSGLAPATAVANSLTSCAGATLAAGRTDGLPANPLVASAGGESVEIDWAAADRAGVVPKVVIVNKMGPWGNGALANTGNIAQVCKKVLPDADGATNYAGQFGIQVNVGGNTPRGYGVGGISLGFEGGQTPLLAEGASSCNFMRRIALPNWLTSARMTEAGYAGANWPGWDGPPVLRIETAAGTPTTTPASGQPMPSVGAGWQVDKLDFAHATARDDLRLTIENKPIKKRRLQMCIKLLDNTVGGDETRTWSFQNNSVAMPNLTTPENGTEVCETTYVPILEDANGNATAFVQNVNPTALIKGYAPGYPRAEFSWSNATGSGADSGTLPSAQVAARFWHNGLFQFTVPASVLNSKTSGDLKYTLVIMFSQTFTVCKTVVDNTNGQTEGALFTLSGTANNSWMYTSGDLSTTGNVTVNEGQTTNNCIVVNAGDATTGALSPASTFLQASETYPSTWKPTPGYPYWVATSSKTGEIVRGTGTTVPANTVPRGDPTVQGDVTVTFYNRTGEKRFMRLCKELLTDNNTGRTITSAGFELQGNEIVAGASRQTVKSTVTASEGGAYADACTADIPVDDLATQVSATEVLAAQWAAYGGSAAGYPTWRVVNLLTRTDVAGVGGAGASTGVIDLAKIAAPAFAVVFSNQADYAPPTVAKMFQPTDIKTGGTSVVTITLTNTSASNAAVLTADFTDTLPQKVVLASDPAASTTCRNADDSAAATLSVAAGSVTLPMGSLIPKGGSCTITFKVTSSVVGSYDNVLPVASLKTGLGNNAAEAKATLKVQSAEPVPVPTLSSGLLALLSLVLAGGAGTMLSRRRR